MLSCLARLCDRLLASLQQALVPMKVGDGFAHQKSGFAHYAKHRIRAPKRTDSRTKPSDSRTMENGFAHHGKRIRAPKKRIRAPKKRIRALCEKQDSGTKPPDSQATDSRTKVSRTDPDRVAHQRFVTKRTDSRTTTISFAHQADLIHAPSGPREYKPYRIPESL